MDGAGNHTIRKPFLEHVRELQLRLTWAVLAIVVGGVLAYMASDGLLAIIQRPLGQTLYYTSPTGGFSFIFKLSAVGGLILALPMILYQFFKFIGPLLGKAHRLLIVSFVLWSINLAYAGVLFAYLFSLPAALHFLAKFGGENIQSLITADEYFNFALAYLAGFAVLFQLPLIILFINKIKPLKPGKMMGAQRYIILASFVIAAILTPTPDPINQAIMAVPVVLLYQLSIIMVWLVNRVSKPVATKPVPQPILPDVPQAPRPQTPSLGYGMSGYGEPAKPAQRPAAPRPVMADIVLR